MDFRYFPVIQMLLCDPVGNPVQKWYKLCSLMWKSVNVVYFYFLLSLMIWYHMMWKIKFGEKISAHLLRKLPQVWVCCKNSRLHKHTLVSSMSEMIQIVFTNVKNYINILFLCFVVVRGTASHDAKNKVWILFLNSSRQEVVPKMRRHQ